MFFHSSRMVVVIKSIKKGIVYLRLMQSQFLTYNDYIFPFLCLPRVAFLRIAGWFSSNSRKYEHENLLDDT